MTRACNSCNNGCGRGVAQTDRPDPVFRELCAILCRVRSEACQGLFDMPDDAEQRRVRLSEIAEDRARNSPELQRAVNRKYGRGMRPNVNAERLVPYNGPRRFRNRRPLSPDQLRDALRPLRDRLLREARNQIGEAAVRRISRGWMKLVPVLNVLSTVYDVYDIASTGYDIYRTVDQALSQYDGDVYRVRPDVAIENADGQLQDIYDFKFDGDRYRDGQDVLFDEALRNEAGNPNPDVRNNGTVSPGSCECDGNRFPNVSAPMG